MPHRLPRRPLKMLKPPILLTEALTPPPALVRAGLETLPAIIRGRGERTSRRFIEFFTASIRNRNTRAAYARAVKQFLDWCEDRRLELHDIDALTVAAYVEQLGSRTAKPTVKQHLASVKQLFAYLTSGGILETNPAASVRGPKYDRQRFATQQMAGHTGSRSDLGGAAVDEQFGAGDETAVIGGEENRGPGDFIRRAEAAHRDPVHDTRQHLLACWPGLCQSVIGGSVDRTRTERVHADFPFLQIHRPRARE
jgi:Phage integrase, N-terminal SAM-like domain